MSIRHVVMWKLRGPSLAERDEQRIQLAEHLRALPAVIPHIQSFEVGVGDDLNDDYYDVVLISDFADRAALKEYVSAPEHQKVIAYVQEFVAERSAVDYTITGAGDQQS